MAERELIEGAFYWVKTDFPGWSSGDRWVPALRLTPAPTGPKAWMSGWLVLGYPEPAWDDQAIGRGPGTNAFAISEIGPCLGTEPDSARNEPVVPERIQRSADDWIADEFPETRGMR